ncbi:hypothetical protein [Plantactinospora soyae]|uniref:Uncharacterized protein n=1 Tax=Plantactinospora soyae TaxID=1544732 RepID=A0A927R8M3_9ACTN|nr:hypothetical protein [Plantactinospora soyae]MBE1488941.1 hypothetical protein [Plantactinospora soyae]
MGGPDMGGPDMGGPDMGGPDMGGPDMGGPDMGGPDMGGTGPAPNGVVGGADVGGGVAPNGVVGGPPYGFGCGAPNGVVGGADVGGGVAPKGVVGGADVGGGVAPNGTPPNCGGTAPPPPGTIRTWTYASRGGPPGIVAGPMPGSRRTVPSLSPPGIRSGMLCPDHGRTTVRTISDPASLGSMSIIRSGLGAMVRV